MSDKKMRVIILARVSSKSDRQDYTRQVNDLKELIHQKGWSEVHKPITSKVSASKTHINKREDLQELFELVKARKIDKVVVTELSRVSRRMKDAKFFVEYLRQYDVSVYIKSYNIESIADNPQTQLLADLMITILADFAQREADELSRRIKSGQKNSNKKPGRPKGSTSYQEKAKTNSKYKKAISKIKSGFSLADVARMCELSRRTIINIKNELKEDSLI